MKIIRITFFSLLALSLVVCTAIFIFFQTFDTDQYLPQIVQKASLALGRPVSIAGLGLGLSEQGITLDAGPLIVADDPAFTSQPFIKVDKVRLSLDLMSLIFQRKIHITEILLQSPQIHFIRSQDGNINARSIGNPVVIASPSSSVIASPKGEAISDRTSNPVEIAASPSAPRNDTIKLFGDTTVKSIRIRDAAISFIDQSKTDPLDIWLLNINVNLKDFSLSNPFQLSFHASPLLLKGIAPGTPDTPIFKDISGIMQSNKADITFTDGVIKNFNIFKTVLSHALGVFGGMEGIIDKLGAEDMIIKKAEVKFSLHDKTVFIDDSLIETNIFELTAKGSVDQGLNTDMQTLLRLNEDVSAALVNEFDGLRFLCDDSKRITIGASLKGVIPHLKYKPDKDFRKKSKKALMEDGGNILGALLSGGKI